MDAEGPLLLRGFLGALLLGAVFFVSGASARDPWLIGISSDSAITPSTTRQELVRRYGAANVRDQDLDSGEGDIEHGTALFPGDPTRAIEIFWGDFGRKPSVLKVRGKVSRWKTSHRISLGTSLADLERLNGRPFTLAGFGWDYSGTVESWENGLLERELGGHGRVILRLGDPGGRVNASRSELDQVEGDRPFSSGNPVMRKINPRVYEMVWDFGPSASNPSPN